MNDISDMTPEQKAARYRHMAQAALLSAQSAKDEKLRQSFVQLAKGWHALATQWEATKTLEDFVRGVSRQAG